MNQDEEIKKVLSQYKRIAVVGLSPDPERPSFGVSQYMQSQGYDIVPVRPPAADGSQDVILGVKSVAKLKDLPYKPEIVDVFRKSDAVPEIVDEAIAAGAKVIWLQEGVVNPVAEEKARQKGLKVFSDLCILKEHARLLRRR